MKRTNYNNTIRKASSKDKHTSKLLTCYLKHIVVTILRVERENYQSPLTSLAASLDLHSQCGWSSAHTEIEDCLHLIKISSKIQKLCYVTDPGSVYVGNCIKNTDHNWAIEGHFQ